MRNLRLATSASCAFQSLKGKGDAKMQMRPLVLANTLISTALISSALAQTIWMSPQSVGAFAVPNYMDLFRPEAPRASAAANVCVLGVSAEFQCIAPTTN
jgi:hypothetical protein